MMAKMMSLVALNLLLFMLLVQILWLYLMYYDDVIDVTDALVINGSAKYVTDITLSVHADVKATQADVGDDVIDNKAAPQADANFDIGLRM